MDKKTETMSLPNRQIFSIENSRFMLHNSKEAHNNLILKNWLEADFHLPHTIHVPENARLALATVFDIRSEGHAIFSAAWFHHNIEIYQKEDDVFQKDFLEGIILNGIEETNVEITKDAHEYLKELGTKWIHCSKAAEGGDYLKPGPYAVFEGSLYEVWRLHEDKNGCFFTAVVPNLTKPFAQLEVPLTKDGFLEVAIPSRIRSQPSSGLPLAGMRIGVKDNFHLMGLKTSLGNRAYYQLYPPRVDTAKCIQQLIDAGVVVLGKTKLNSFGCWEEPTEYIDYQAPWNPRGDGYQSPGGSSSGSGAAVGSYDWIDITIGSDTGGSVSRPGLWNGCFSMRPTLGAIPTDGLVSSIKFFDMPGFLGRDLEKCKTFAATWYGNMLSTHNVTEFSHILWASDYWDWCDFEPRQIAKNFVYDLEALLRHKHVEVSFREEWRKSPPKEAGDMSMDDYMKAPTDDIWYDDYHAHDEFRADYSQKFHKAPYISPAVRNGWDFAKNIKIAARDEAKSRLEIYRIWFNKQIMHSDGRNTLLVVPMENMAPRYRDDFMGPVRGHPGVCSLLLAPVIQVPQLVVPVGEIPYFSKVTERIERLPFAVGLIGLPGSDMQLIDTALACLKKAGRPTAMLTGRSAFSQYN